MTNIQTVRLLADIAFLTALAALCIYIALYWQTGHVYALGVLVTLMILVGAGLGLLRSRPSLK